MGDYDLAGLLLAILGAMGMGCAGFFAEQHALISYSIVPGVPALLYKSLQTGMSLPLNARLL